MVCRAGAKLCHVKQEGGKEVGYVLFGYEFFPICVVIQLQSRKGNLVAAESVALWWFSASKVFWQRAF